jgi:hypothetical protein
MRRLSGLILGVALVAASAGTAAAAPNRTATLWACTTATGFQVHVDWSGYHPDTLDAVAWVDGGSVSSFTTTRSVQWKYGTSWYDTSYAGWSASSVSFTAATWVAVNLYAHGRFLAETNAVQYGSMAACF